MKYHKIVCVHVVAMQVTEKNVREAIALARQQVPDLMVFPNASGITISAPNMPRVWWGEYLVCHGGKSFTAMKPEAFHAEYGEGWPDEQQHAADESV